MTSEIEHDHGLSLVEVLDRLEAMETDGAVRVDDILRAFGPRAFGPLLLIPAVVAVLPIIGALPGVSWSCSALVLLISVQFLLSSRKLWLPKFLRQAHISRASFDAATRAARPWFRRVGVLFEPRLEPLLHPIFMRVVALICVILGLLMFVFSLIPGGIVIPAAAVLLLAVAVTAHDGLVLLFGLVIASAAMVMIGSGAIDGAVNAVF